MIGNIVVLNCEKLLDSRYNMIYNEYTNKYTFDAIRVR